MFEYCGLPTSTERMCQGTHTNSKAASIVLEAFSYNIKDTC